MLRDDTEESDQSEEEAAAEAFTDISISFADTAELHVAAV